MTACGERRKWKRGNLPFKREKYKNFYILGVSPESLGSLNTGPFDLFLSYFCGASE
jgi:hypothetical protein